MRGFRGALKKEPLSAVVIVTVLLQNSCNRCESDTNDLSPPSSSALMQCCQNEEAALATNYKTSTCENLAEQKLFASSHLYFFSFHFIFLLVMFSASLLCSHTNSLPNASLKAACNEAKFAVSDYYDNQMSDLLLCQGRNVSTPCSKRLFTTVYHMTTFSEHRKSPTMFV